MKKKRLTKVKLVKGAARKKVGRVKSVQKHKVKGEKFKGSRRDEEDYE